jgi:hypothetical protein
MTQHNVPESTFARVLHLLRQIESIMDEEEEQNWICGVRSLIADMERAATKQTAQEDTLNVVKTTYRTMMGAKDGFGDYVIWRDDFRARVQANREFDALRTEVWDLLMDTSVEEEEKGDKSNC